MPDAMILPDLGQPASYYAILKHTHKPITPWHTGHQFPDWKFGQGFSDQSLYSKTNKNVHTHSNAWPAHFDPDSYQEHCILSTWLFSHFTINEPWTETFPRNESLDKTQSTKSTVKLYADGVSWEKTQFPDPKYYYYWVFSWWKVHIAFLTHKQLCMLCLCVCVCMYRLQWEEEFKWRTKAGDLRCLQSGGTGRRAVCDPCWWKLELLRCHYAKWKQRI